MKQKRYSQALRMITMLSMITATSATVLAGELMAPKPVQAVQNVQKKSEVPYRNVMYYGDWSVWGGQGNYYPKDLPADVYTHMNYAFIDLDENGDLILTDADAAFGNPVGSGNSWGDELSGVIPALAALKAEHPNMKVGASFGGWSKSADFTTVAANPTKRARFIENVLKFIKYTDMDFVDIDWEYPASVREPDLVDNKNDEGTPNAKPEDRQNFITLMAEMRAALDKQGKTEGKYYELSCALPGTPGQLEKGIDVERLFEIVDFGNMMTYDMNGAWGDRAGHQTALYSNPEDPTGFSVENVVSYLKSKNVPSEKIVIGAAFYTRGWDSVEKGSDSSQPGLFQATAPTNKDADQSPSRGADNEAPTAVGDGGRKGGVWSYRSLDKLKAAIPDLKEYWDDVAKAPYLYSESTKDFYTYDNVKSITYKTEFVKENQLGGVISWMASQDKATTSTKRDELSNAIKEGLYGKEALPETTNLGQTSLDLAVSIQQGKTDSGGEGYELTITNQEPLEAYGGDALTLADRYYSTVKKPTFIITMKDGSTLSKGDYRSGSVTEKNGKTYVDLSAVYDGKFIKPGLSYTFKLATKNGAIFDASNIAQIELVQHYNATTPLGSQIIYQDTQLVEGAPTLSGVSDVTLELGSAFDPLAQVRAYDQKDGDLTSSIQITGTVDTQKVGTYTLNYSVTNSAGKETTAQRTVTVVEVPTNNAAQWQAATVYYGGDEVVYNGVKYIANYWTQGDRPDLSGAYGPWRVAN